MATLVGGSRGGEIWQTADGRQFPSRAAAEAHERSLRGGGGGGATPFAANPNAPPAFTTFVPGSAATQPRTPEQEAAYQEMVKAGPGAPFGVTATRAQQQNETTRMFVDATRQNADANRLNVGTALDNLRAAAGGVVSNRFADATRNDQIAGNYDSRQAPALDTSQADLARQDQQQTLARLRQFKVQSEGLSALRAFAAGPTGPSEAEAQLRMQSARDRRAALSIARSARGGPAAVAQAMQVAQGEQSAIGAETRGQATILRANEAAARRQEALAALQSVASGEQQASQTQLGALTAEGNLITGTRGQDIDAARANLDSRLQTLGLNDNQVRFFSGLADQARQDAANAVLTAASKGVDTQLAIEQVQMQYTAMAWNMLTDTQRLQLEEYGIRMGVKMNDQRERNAFLSQVLGFVGSGLVAGATAFGGPGAGAAAGAGLSGLDVAIQNRAANNAGPG
jgi:hypothetical protein